jgi:hypothetical protein
MILLIAVRSVLAHPIRSAMLACGFGLGVSVMATLLGVGEVILEQARSPALVGGGDVVVTSAAGRVESARFLLSSVLGVPPLRARVAAASPRGARRCSSCAGSASFPSWPRAASPAASARSAIGRPRAWGPGWMRRGTRPGWEIRRQSCAPWTASIRSPTFPRAFHPGRSGSTSTEARKTRASISPSWWARRWPMAAVPLECASSSSRRAHDVVRRSDRSRRRRRARARARPRHRQERGPARRLRYRIRLDLPRMDPPGARTSSAAPDA